MPIEDIGPMTAAGADCDACGATWTEHLMIHKADCAWMASEYSDAWPKTTDKVRNSSHAS